MAWGISAFEKDWKIRKDLVGGILLLLAIVSCGQVYSDEHTYQFDLSALTQKIREDGALQNGGCLLLLDHYWIWTRGEMMIGSKIHFIEVNSRQPFNSLNPEAKSCVYAITLPGRDLWFHQPGEPEWKQI